MKDKAKNEKIKNFKGVLKVAASTVLSLGLIVAGFFATYKFSPLLIVPTIFIGLLPLTYNALCVTAVIKDCARKKLFKIYDYDKIVMEEKMKDSKLGVQRVVNDNYKTPSMKQEKYIANMMYSAEQKLEYGSFNKYKFLDNLNVSDEGVNNENNI